MEQAWPTAPTTEEVKDMEATLHHYLTQIKAMNQQMANDQADIERLKRETSPLREKSERLGEETRFLLKSLASLDLWNPQKAV